MGPGQSSDRASGITPSRGSLPCAGFSPNTPQNEDGMRMDPPVSVPSAMRTQREATAAADPPEEPPVMRSEPNGLWAGPHAEIRLVVPNASSCMLHLPTTMAPALRKRVTTSASRSATFPRYASQQPVVSWPATSNRSFTATGTPASGPDGSRAASSRASSPKTWLKAFVTGCHRSMQSSACSTASITRGASARGA